VGRRIKIKIKPRNKEFLQNGGRKSIIGFLLFGYLMVRPRHACAAEGCLAGGGGDTTVDFVEGVFVHRVLEGRSLLPTPTQKMNPLLNLLGPVMRAMKQSSRSSTHWMI